MQVWGWQCVVCRVGQQAGGPGGEEVFTRVHGLPRDEPFPVGSLL